MKSDDFWVKMKIALDEGAIAAWPGMSGKSTSLEMSDDGKKIIYEITLESGTDDKGNI